MSVYKDPDYFVFMKGKKMLIAHDWEVIAMWIFFLYPNWERHLIMESIFFFVLGQKQICFMTDTPCCIVSGTQTPIEEFLLSVNQEQVTVSFYGSSGTQGIYALRCGGLTELSQDIKWIMCVLVIPCSDDSDESYYW